MEDLMMANIYVTKNNVKELNRYVTPDIVKKYEGKILLSVTFGFFSTTLQFDDCSILINDDIAYGSSAGFVTCDYKNPADLIGLFSLLNEVVQESSLDDDFVMTLSFKEEQSIRISSYKSGYESYVLNIEGNQIPIL